MWSRLGLGSITVVVPDASRPAISTQDFTCADATGSVYSIPCSGAPCTVNGAKRLSVAEIQAPISRSGMATRSTGRRRIDSSPSSVHVPPGWPASQPGASRISVPALPTSRCASDAPRRPGPRMVSVPCSPPCSTSAPSLRTAFSVVRVSAASR